VRFVDYNVLETELLERRWFNETDLVMISAPVWCSGEEDNVEVRSALFELASNSGALFWERPLGVDW
jgi:hypothetical protein